MLLAIGGTRRGTLARSVLRAVIALVFLSSVCLAQSTTIRIRFIDGKTGKALRVKYYNIQPNVNDDIDYKLDKIENNVLILTFTNATTFTFSNDAYYRCDAKTETAPQITYKLQDIVDHGIVSPNICGSVHAQPAKGELLIYSRHAHWWETLGNLRGLFVCG
jgi:hypothetical protein